MNIKSTTLVAALVLATSLSAPSALADGLLGGVLGGGGSGGGLLSIDRGSAGDSSTVNIGLGSDNQSPDNIADVNLGNANANVSGGNGQGGLLNNGGLLGTGLLDGDDDGGVLGSGILGSSLTAGINLGGLSLDLTIPGLDDLLGSGGGNGGNGPGNGNGNGNNGGRTLVGSVGEFQVSCSLDDGRRVLQLASQASVNPRTWSRAANVQIVPIRLCPQARGQVAQIFRASGKIQQLRSAVAADALIVASLNRSRYDIGDVFAVEAQGGSLTVYVY